MIAWKDVVGSAVREAKYNYITIVVARKLPTIEEEEKTTKSQLKLGNLND